MASPARSRWRLSGEWRSLSSVLRTASPLPSLAIEARMPAHSSARFDFSPQQPPPPQEASQQLQPPDGGDEEGQPSVAMEDAPDGSGAAAAAASVIAPKERTKMLGLIEKSTYRVNGLSPEVRPHALDAAAARPSPATALGMQRALRWLLESSHHTGAPSCGYLAFSTEQRLPSRPSTRRYYPADLRAGSRLHRQHRAEGDRREARGASRRRQSPRRRCVPSPRLMCVACRGRSRRGPTPPPPPPPPPPPHARRSYPPPASVSFLGPYLLQTDRAARLRQLQTRRRRSSTVARASSRRRVQRRPWRASRWR